MTEYAEVRALKQKEIPLALEDLEKKCRLGDFDYIFAMAIVKDIQRYGGKRREEFLGKYNKIINSA